MLPLHQALLRYAPFTFLMELVTLYPKALRIEDSYFQRLPLHFACFHAPYPELISYLVKSNPGAVRVRDKFGRLPLHYLCFGQAHEYVLRSLIDLYPQATHVKDEYGWLPLHIAVRYECPYGAIEQLVRTYPSGLTVRTDRMQMLPCDLAQRFDLKQDEKTKELLEKSRFLYRQLSSALTEYTRPELRTIDAYSA